MRIHRLLYNLYVQSIHGYCWIQTLYLPLLQHPVSQVIKQYSEIDTKHI